MKKDCGVRSLILHMPEWLCIKLETKAALEKGAAFFDLFTEIRSELCIAAGDIFCTAFFMLGVAVETRRKETGRCCRRYCFRILSAVHKRCVGCIGARP